MSDDWVYEQIFLDYQRYIRERMNLSEKHIDESLGPDLRYIKMQQDALYRLLERDLHLIFHAPLNKSDGEDN